MYIAYDLFTTHPIWRSSVYMLGPTHSVCMKLSFHYTLLADILHSSSQLILQELTFFCNLFSFLQKVLGSGLHRGCQNVGLLGAPFFLVGWSFVAGVYQSGNLREEQQIIQQQEIC